MSPWTTSTDMYALMVDLECVEGVNPFTTQCPFSILHLFVKKINADPITNTTYHYIVTSGFDRMVTGDGP